MSIHGPSAPTIWTSLRLTEPVPVYYLASGFDHPDWPVVGMDNPNEIVLASWGLVPHWVRSEEDAAAIRNKTLNARAETLFEKPAFRDAAKTGRCLVLVSGFYESHKHAGRSYPFFCHLQGGRPFMLAGILARSDVGGRSAGAPGKEAGRSSPAGLIARSDVGGRLTFSVVTTAANELMSRVHNEKKRMPVIFESEERALRWIYRGLTPQAAGQMLKARDIPGLVAHPVSRMVFAHGGDNNVPRVQARVDYPELGAI